MNLEHLNIILLSLQMQNKRSNSNTDTYNKPLNHYSKSPSPLLPFLNESNNKNQDALFQDFLYQQTQEKIIKPEFLNFNKTGKSIVKITKLYRIMERQKKFNIEKISIKQKIKNDAMLMFNSVDLAANKKQQNLLDTKNKRSPCTNVGSSDKKSYYEYFQQQLNKLDEMEKSIILGPKQSQKQNPQIIDIRIAKRSRQMHPKKFNNDFQSKQKLIQPYRIGSILLAQRPPLRIDPYNSSMMNINQTLKKNFRKFNSCIGDRYNGKLENSDICTKINNKNEGIEPWELDENVSIQ